MGWKLIFRPTDKLLALCRNSPNLQKESRRVSPLLAGLSDPNRPHARSGAQGGCRPDGLSGEWAGVSAGGCSHAQGLVSPLMLAGSNAGAMRTATIRGPQILSIVAGNTLKVPWSPTGMTLSPPGGRGACSSSEFVPGAARPGKSYPPGKRRPRWTRGTYGSPPRARAGAPRGASDRRRPSRRHGRIVLPQDSRAPRFSRGTLPCLP